MPADTPNADGEYEPTWESLDAHPVPDWYHDAKLGIFVHWGVYSVPAWAPPDATLDDLDSVSPYAEWYPYYMYEEGSETWEYHREHYGAGVEYADFVDDWEAENWDPEEWADLFADVGARYVVLTGEHHDGFPLWDSHYAAYDAASTGPERDVVADLCAAVRDRGLRFGASYHANYNYYQPGFEGRFGHPDFEAGGPIEERGGPGPEYVDFMNAKHREIVRKYDPDLLWFDVPKADSDHLHAKELVADYYNRAANAGKAVAVNNRAATDAWGFDAESWSFDTESAHGDFVTPEYESFDDVVEYKWETCRGIGTSFGYNRAENERTYMDAAELVWSFVDIVSKNGNLLINVGPKADGTIPEAQRRRLEALGEWLDTNGEAIYGTTYWETPTDEHSDETVRYTWTDGTLYALTPEWPAAFELDLRGHAGGVEAVSVLGAGDCDWETRGERLRVDPGSSPGDAHAYAFRIEGVPNERD